jgi:hypothetical protein
MLAPFCDATVTESSPRCREIRTIRARKVRKNYKEKALSIKKRGQMSFSKGTITKPKSEKRTERSNSIIILRILREDKKKFRDIKSE